jgi:2-dehydrotetronate isomerase
MMFNEVPFIERFAAAAAAGFDAVEFLFPYEHPAETVRDAAVNASVDIVLFNMPPGNWAVGERGIASFPDREPEFDQGLETALAYARILKVPRLHMMAGLSSAENPSAQACYEKSLRKAAQAVAGEGIDLLIEPINRRDMPGYFLNDFEMAEKIVAESGLTNVKLQYDIYHRQILHGDVMKSLGEMMPMIGHIQTASVPLRNEPGTGELNDHAIFDLLDRLDYQGAVGCEYRPAGDTVDGLGWLKQYRS